MIPFASIWRARFVSIACMNGIVSRARKSGEAFVSRTTSLLPWARTPEIVRLAVDHGLGTLHDVEELHARRLHARVREPVERIHEAPRRHALAVRELEARLDRERVGLAVP